MRTYRVLFYLSPEERGQEQYLGTVVVDTWEGEELTLAAKAFRHAPPQCQIANKVKFEETVFARGRRNDQGHRRAG